MRAPQGVRRAVRPCFRRPSRTWGRERDGLHTTRRAKRVKRKMNKPVFLEISEFAEQVLDNDTFSTGLPALRKMFGSGKRAAASPPEIAEGRALPKSPRPSPAVPLLVEGVQVHVSSNILPRTRLGLAEKLRAAGAVVTVFPSVPPPTTTHILVEDEDISKPRKPPESAACAVFVSEKWCEDSLKQRRLLPLSGYVYAPPLPAPAEDGASWLGRSARESTPPRDAPSEEAAAGELTFVCSRDASAACGFRVSWLRGRPSEEPAWRGEANVVEPQQAAAPSGSAAPLRGDDTLVVRLHSGVASARPPPSSRHESRAPPQPPPASAGGTSRESLARSSLQKCVRRGLRRPALRAAAFLLLRRDLSTPTGAAQLLACLRRVAVIGVEDSLPHPGFPLVAWLIASVADGFVPSPSHIAGVLRLVADIAACPFREAPPPPFEAPPAPPPPPLSLRHSILLPPAHPSRAALSPDDDGVVRSMLFLSALAGGGLSEWDVALLQGRAHSWAHRLAPPPPPPPLPLGAAAVANAAEHVPHALDVPHVLPPLPPPPHAAWSPFLAAVWTDAAASHPDVCASLRAAAAFSEGVAAEQSAEQLAEHLDAATALLETAAGGRLAAIDIPLAAVDYHTDSGRDVKHSASIDTLWICDGASRLRASHVLRGGEGEEKEVLKHAVWFCSSSASDKALVLPAALEAAAQAAARGRLQPVWDEVRGAAEAHARLVIARAFGTA